MYKLLQQGGSVRLGHTDPPLAEWYEGGDSRGLVWTDGVHIPLCLGQKGWIELAGHLLRQL